MSKRDTTYWGCMSVIAARRAGCRDAVGLGRAAAPKSANLPVSATLGSSPDIFGLRSSSFQLIRRHPPIPFPCPRCSHFLSIVIGPRPDPSSRCDVSRSPHNITPFCKALSPFALPNTSRSVASSFIIIFPLVSPHRQPFVSQPTSRKLCRSPVAASASAHRCAHRWICGKEGIEILAPT